MSQTILPEDLFAVLKGYEQQLGRLQRALQPPIIHRVGISIAVDPVSPPFLNSYENYQAAYTGGARPAGPNIGWAPAAFYKYQGRVYLSGVVWTTSSSSGTAIFQLPQGFRPYDHVMWAAIGNNGVARLDIDYNGNVINQSSSGLSGTAAGGPQYLSLNGSFAHA